MADTTQSPSFDPVAIWRRIDKAWLAVVVIPLIVLVLDAAQFWPVLKTASGAFVGTAPIILFAISAVAYVKASGAETLIANAFVGNPVRMIVMAAMLGGLSPFCSCEIIPFIAALLAVGAPLSAVMAFWLASPLIDPPSLIITASALGWDFAIAKALAAVGIGLMGGTYITDRGYRFRASG